MVCVGASSSWACVACDQGAVSVGCTKDIVWACPVAGAC